MYPDTVDVLVEIPYASHVKYEIENDKLLVDRVLSTSMMYPGNYGHIPGTLAGDGDPMDALILNHDSFYPGCVVECRVIGVLYTEDEKGTDEKIMVVPLPRIDHRFEKIHDLDDVPPMQRERIWHFFQHYKDLEKKKHVMVTGWGNKEEACQRIMEATLK